MQFIMALLVSSTIVKIVLSETIKEPPNSRDGQPVPGTPTDFPKLNTVGSNPLLNSLWVFRPETQESHTPGDVESKRIIMKPSHTLTRLAKTLTLGFDPFFNKGNFEPFERRPKPVTLVAFRKNGLLPRTKANAAVSKSAEIAELQSPFNYISNFWVDD